MQIVWIGLGGFAGAISRYYVGTVAQWVGRALEFPIGTLTVNLLGSFVFGLLGTYAAAQDIFPEHARAFLFIGFLGSFTTFSTFSNDAVSLFQGGQDLEAILYLGLHIFLGLAAVWLGARLGTALWT